MSTIKGSELIPPNGQIVVGGGKYFQLLLVTTPVNVKFYRGGTSDGATNVDGGYTLGPLDNPFERLTITGVPGEVVEWIVGDEIASYRQSVAVVNTVATKELPSSTLATPVRVALNTATDVPIVAATPSRRRVTIQNPSGNVDSINVGPVGQLGTTRGFEIEPGMSFEFVTTAAIYGRAVTGTPSVQAFEET